MKPVKREDPIVDKLMELFDRASEKIEDARTQAPLLRDQLRGGRFGVWKEIYEAKASLQRALELLDDAASPYSELFYPNVLYDHMHDYSQPDGIARKPAKQKQGRRHK